VNEAGYEEEDCKGGGGAFGEGVEPEGAGDCGNFLGVYCLQEENQHVPMFPILLDLDCILNC
jgi:hypothetical protein